MSSYDLNSNPVLVKQLIKQYQDAAASARQCPDSVLPAFERELHQLGFQFEVLNQAEALLPKHKKTVLPLVMKYYTLAKNPAEKNELLRWFLRIITLTERRTQRDGLYRIRFLRFVPESMCRTICGSFPIPHSEETGRCWFCFSAS